MIKLGKTARHVREKRHLSQRAAAKLLGISAVHLCNVENNNSVPSPALVERYEELWGVNLYILAWCLFGDSEKLPPGLREAANTLGEALENELIANGLANSEQAADAEDRKIEVSRRGFRNLA